MPAEVPGSVGFAGSGPLARAVAQRLAAAAIDLHVLASEEGGATVRAGGADSPGHRGGVNPSWDGNVVVTAFPDLARLQAFVGAFTGQARRADRVLHLLDLTPMSPAAMREVSRQCRSAGIEATGASLPCAGLLDASAALYVDRGALAVQALGTVLEALGEKVVATGPAGSSKAVATIVELVVAVNTAAVREAFALAASAGIDAATLSALLSKGSGANAVIARAAGSSEADDAPVASRLALLRGTLADATNVAREVDHPAFFAALGIASLWSASIARSRDVPPQPLAAAAARVSAR